MTKLIFKKKYLYFTLLALFVIVPIAAWCNTYLQFYTLNSGQSQSLANIYGQNCTMINNTGRNYFVPNKTGSEWDAFRTFARSNSVDVGCYDDGVCDTAVNNEDCNTCPEDCGLCSTYCGNSVCENGENTSNCPLDCSYTCSGPGYCSTYTIQLRCLKNPAEGCSWGQGFY